MTTLDVGCGFDKTTHQKRGVVGIDLNKGVCDVQADAHQLPFRNDAFTEITMHAVLEHLERPIQALKEARRVARPKAKIKILIPADARYNLLMLKGLIFEFPFSVTRIIKAYASKRYFVKKLRIPYERGLRHKTQITPKDISRVLKITKIQEIQHRHSWCKGRKGKLFRRLLHCEPKIGVWKDIYVEAVKQKTDWNTVNNYSSENLPNQPDNIVA
jgi:ubiquinone/menaquinone biosynthesis C-methylase UbiE